MSGREPGRWQRFVCSSGRRPAHVHGGRGRCRWVGRREPGGADLAGRLCSGCHGAGDSDRFGSGRWCGDRERGGVRVLLAGCFGGGLCVHPGRGAGAGSGVSGREPGRWQRFVCSSGRRPAHVHGGRGRCRWVGRREPGGADLAGRLCPGCHCAGDSDRFGSGRWCGDRERCGVRVLLAGCFGGGLCAHPGRGAGAGSGVSGREPGRWQRFVCSSGRRPAHVHGGRGRCRWVGRREPGGADLAGRLCSGCHGAGDSDRFGSGRWCDHRERGGVRVLLAGCFGGGLCVHPGRGAGAGSGVSGREPGRWQRFVCSSGRRPAHVHRGRGRCRWVGRREPGGADLAGRLCSGCHGAGDSDRFGSGRR